MFTDPSGLFAICPVKALKMSKKAIDQIAKGAQHLGRETMQWVRWLNSQIVRKNNWIANTARSVFGRGGGGAQTILSTIKQTVYNPSVALRLPTYGNFKHNLQQFTGQTGVGMRAHHVLPNYFISQFSKIFDGTRLSIHHPIFGAWVDIATHQSYQWHSKYNQAWQMFFDTIKNPTIEQTLQFAMELAYNFGFKLNW